MVFYHYFILLGGGNGIDLSGMVMQIPFFWLASEVIFDRFAIVFAASSDTVAAERRWIREKPLQNDFKIGHFAQKCVWISKKYTAKVQKCQMP